MCNKRLITIRISLKSLSVIRKRSSTLKMGHWILTWQHIPGKPVLGKVDTKIKSSRPTSARN